MHGWVGARTIKRGSGCARGRGRWLLLVTLAVTVVGGVLGTAVASADHCNPNADPNCQPHTPPPPPPPDPVGDCPLGSSLRAPSAPPWKDIPGPDCVPGPSSEFTYEANEADAADPSTFCSVVLEGSRSQAEDGSGQVDFRTTTSCDHLLKVVTFDARFLDSRGRQLGAAPEYHCHLGGGGTNCGLQRSSTTGFVGGLSPGEYLLQSTVRLVLNDPIAPDPWVVTPGTSPDPFADPKTDGICAPGQLVVRCNVSLPITVSDGRVFYPRTPNTKDECTLNPFKYGCPGNPPKSADPSTG